MPRHIEECVVHPGARFPVGLARLSVDDPRAEASLDVFGCVVEDVYAMGYWNHEREVGERA